MTIKSWKDESNGDLKYEITLGVLELLSVNLTDYERKLLRQYDNSSNLLDKIEGIILVAKKIENRKEKENGMQV